jgi:dCTP deaminase
MSGTAQYSVLSDKTILKYRDRGEIVIEPFNNRNLNPNSYDVTLGSWFFREQVLQDEWIGNIYNVYSQDHVARVWGEPQQAKPHSYYMEHGLTLENIRPDEEIIFINPGETILAHTREFIGGRTSVTTMMKSRSSMGRNFIECCKCAGLGDCGYFNRWTVEITNNSTRYKIPLVVGRRVAQIIFFETDGTLDSYNNKGKYQTTDDLTQLERNWEPRDMLPKMYRDWENNTQKLET